MRDLAIVLMACALPAASDSSLPYPAGISRAKPLASLAQVFFFAIFASLRETLLSCHLLLPPRIVQEADQLADIARLQAGPRDAELFGARVHGGAVAPQRGGERDQGEGIGAGAQFRCVAGSLGAGAVTIRAAALGKDTFADEGRACGFEIAQAGQEAEDVRELLAL